MNYAVRCFVLYIILISLRILYVIAGSLNFISIDSLICINVLVKYCSLKCCLQYCVLCQRVVPNYFYQRSTCSLTVKVLHGRSPSSKDFYQTSTSFESLSNTRFNDGETLLFLSVSTDKLSENCLKYIKPIPTQIPPVYYE